MYIWNTSESIRAIVILLASDLERMVELRLFRPLFEDGMPVPLPSPAFSPAPEFAPQQALASDF